MSKKIIKEYSFKGEYYNFTLVENQRKEMQQAYKRYCFSSDTCLGDVYNNYSNAKERADMYCRDIWNTLDGNSYRIVSHNCMVFTVGFIGKIEGVDVFVYITPSHNYYIPLHDIL